ncbi:unnamed protein product [Prorocentrum cordatum]|uniref:Uncharacterized protein n=1 Tax=Prorocentrum cordatum TaxID=2364126 RepID=A0ABN9PWF1_9DINO|nr:unnamed protein product [Polarella glacialis]
MHMQRSSHAARRHRAGGRRKEEEEASAGGNRGQKSSNHPCLRQGAEPQMIARQPFLAVQLRIKWETSASSTVVPKRIQLARALQGTFLKRAARHHWQVLHSGASRTRSETRSCSSRCASATKRTVVQRPVRPCDAEEGEGG